jgi:hypothetical protein
MTGPAAEPEPGEVYLASPATSTTGDAHGSHARPAGVVERTKNVAHCLTRTKNPERDARTLESPADKHNVPCMTLDAHWQDRYQRPVAKRFWGTRDFEYSGRLSDEARDALLDFWHTTTLLGRRNL